MNKAVERDLINLSNLEEQAFNEWFNTLSDYNKEAINEQFEDTGNFDVESWCWNELDFAINQDGAETYEDMIDVLGEELINFIDVFGYRDELEQMINDFVTDVENEKLENQE